ncbi:MAG: hypothetical protein J4F44_02505 [Acidimicrobiia bacterium]|nr:hypothetical protein [Acidimicrobiia bacterium]
MLTDVVALEREFDYAVPEAWQRDGRAARLRVGSMVRVTLHNRRVGGWVTECDPGPEDRSGPEGLPSRSRPPGPAPGGPGGPGVVAALPLGVGSAAGATEPAAGRTLELQPLAKLVGVGPPPEVLELAGWAARRWAGRRATFFGTASPPRVVEALPRREGRRSSPAPDAAPADAGAEPIFDAAFEHPVSVVRIAPAGDRGPLLTAALRRGDALLVVPQVAEAARLAGWVRRRGVAAALLPEDWARAAAGGVAVGTRAAVFGPMPRLGAVVVLDEHDEALVAEDSPTWSAREVAVERARRAGVPCVLVSPTPTLEAQELASGDVLSVPRQIEREGWPSLEVVDQRDPDTARRGLLTETLVARLRSAGRAVCVLNRKGRARLLACAACEDLVVCDSCAAAVAEGTGASGGGDLGGLDCPRCGERRPRVCSVCGATRLRTLRPGVAKLRSELEVLLGEPVVEVSGPARSSGESHDSDARVVIGTEAALHRIGEADLVAFLDFDQELSATRYRANEQAMALLARAARLVGPRSGGGRILVQTRQPDHPVLQAARDVDPDKLSRHDRALRQQLGFPPFGALAEIAGAAAEAFVERLGHPLGLEVSAVGENRWVVRNADRAALLEALANVERPPGRLRLAIDSSRF